MAFCHGQGNLDTDGCCYVAGAVCPNRWKIVDGRVYEGPDLVDLGTVQEVAATYHNSPAVQQRAIDQVQGMVYVCRVAVEVIVQDPKRINDRAAFEAAWAAHPDYQPIADEWEAIGKPRNWCPLYGPPENQCCYAEDEATNAAKASALTTSAVSIRSQRSG